MWDATDFKALYLNQVTSATVYCSRSFCLPWPLLSIPVLAHSSYSLLVLLLLPPPPLESGDQLQQIGHFKACMTEIYLHIDARMAAS